MTNKKHILVIFYLHKTDSQRQRLYNLVQALLNQGYEIHYIGGDRLQIDSPLLFPNIIIPPKNYFQKRSFLYFIWFSFIAANLVFRQGLTKKFISIVVFHTWHSTLASIGALFSLTPITIFIKSVPWQVRSVITGSFILNFFGKIIDIIGFRLAKHIVSATKTTSLKIAHEIPSTEKKLSVLTYASVLPTLEGSEKKIEIGTKSWETWIFEHPHRRNEIIEKFDLPEKSFIIATFGGRRRELSLEYLIRAINATGNEKLHLLICGDRGEKNRVLSAIVGLGLIHQISFIDSPLEQSKIISGCDIFIVPSREEGISNSLFEALGSGIPIIAADTPELREVLFYDELLFKPKNVDELSIKINTFANNRIRLEEVKELSHKRAIHFSFDWQQKIAEMFNQY